MAKKPAASAAKTKSGPAAATKPAAASTKKAAPSIKKQPKPTAKKADKPEVRKAPAPAPVKPKVEAPPKKPDKPKPDAKKVAAAPAPKAKTEAPVKPAPATKPVIAKPTGSAKAPPAPKAPPTKAADGPPPKPAPSKPAPSKPVPSKPVPSKPVPSKPAPKGSGSKDAKKGAGPAPDQPRFKIPFAGSMVDEKAAAAKLTAAAGLSHVKKMRSDIHVRDENAPRLKKSPLSKKQLQEFKEDLLSRRAQIVNTLQSVESEALFGGSGSLSHTPQHMADAGSDTYDQSLALDIAGHQRTSLRDIDAALQRIEDNTYGICEVFGTPIDLERLRSQPWTKYSIEGAREFERTSYQR